MAKFAIEVFKVFARLRKEAGFVPAIGAKTFASLVRREQEDFFFYVFVQDDRGGGANVDVSLWVAPPESPDASLEKLYVGYKILIGSDCDVDDQFFWACERRILSLIPYVRSLEPLIQQELAHPDFMTERYTVYLRERDVYAKFCEIAFQKRLSSVLGALEVGTEVAKGRAAYKRLNEACITAARELVELDELDKDWYNGHLPSMGSSIASQVYIHALGELSVASRPRI